MAFTPDIGQSGIYKLVFPFDTLVTPKIVYTCRSLRTINDILAAGEEIFDTYYKSIGLTKTDYERDAKANVCIVGLQSGTGEWIYVPTSYIELAPNMNGVKYTSLVLGVSLGPLPDKFNLEGLIAIFKDATTATIGVTPEVKGIVVSQPAILSREEHDRLTLARTEKITQNRTDYSRVREQTQLITQLNAKIEALEKYIAEKL